MKEISAPGFIGGYPALAICVVFVILALVGRLLAEKMVDCTDKKKQFWMGFSILVIYVILLYLLFCLVYFSVETVQAFFILYTLLFILANVVLLLIVLFYHSVRDKRQITEMEKLKLKDM